MYRFWLPTLAAFSLYGGTLCAQDSTPPMSEPAPAAEAPVVPQFPPEAHPWGRFPVGSWKTVRLTTEALDAQGRVVSTSVAETKSTLIQADDLEYQLKIETTADFGGRRLTYPAQVNSHSYWGELNKPLNSAQKVPAAEIELNGKKVACEVRQAVVEQGMERRQSIVHYTPGQFPYVLKRETTVTPLPAAPEGTPPSTTTVEVIAANLPQRVLGVLRSVAFVRTIHENGKGSSTTMEIHSADIPGGVVSHSAEERDAAGIVIRRTTLELLEYGIGTEPEEQASPHRRRYFRKQQRREERRER
jgi:hypothetical protein